MARNSLQENGRVSLDSRRAVVSCSDHVGSIISTWITVTDRKFSGRRHDATGLVYYQARCHNPRSGRFTQALADDKHGNAAEVDQWAAGWLLSRTTILTSLGGL